MIIKRLDDIEQTEVSHNASIKKRVLLSPGELAGVIQFARSIFPPGAVAGEHRHEDMAEVFLVESGQGRIAVDGRTHELAPGTCVTVEAGETHELRNTGEIDLVVTYFGVKTV